MESFMFAGVFFLVAIVGLCVFAICEALLFQRATYQRKYGRVEFGYLWKWQEANSTMRGHWKSSKDNLVRIFPPYGSITSWFVTVCDEEKHELTGRDAEQRAFAIAGPFTRQIRSTPKDSIPQSV